MAAKMKKDGVDGAELERRDFLRMLGAVSLPLVTQACTTDEATPAFAAGHFRALNDPIVVDCEVLRARKQQSIVHEAELLSVDPAFLSHLSVGDQCRVYREDGSFALYTVGETRNESSNDQLRMGLDARNRLGTASTFVGLLDTRVTAAGLTDEEAEAAGELVERLVDDGVSSSVIALAPHGGRIERYTDEQAEYFQSLLAGKGASSWLCRGYKPGGGAYDRWHITSSNISPNSFPLLNQVATRGFAYAVSFHGFSSDMVLVGGGADEQLRQLIRDAIADVLAGSGLLVQVASSDDDYNGDSPNNVVNWMTMGGLGGVQIEQSMRAREMWGLDIAKAVANVIDTLI